MLLIKFKNLLNNNQFFFAKVLPADEAKQKHTIEFLFESILQRSGNTQGHYDKENRLLCKSKKILFHPFFQATFTRSG